jgi:ABC-type transporter Mla MlaB component
MPGSRPTIVCDAEGLDPDALTVGALARLQLRARRLGFEIRLSGASEELLELAGFMGLADVIKAGKTTDQRFE